MRNGFIFDNGLCVDCKACSAACMLENGWEFRARNIYSSNINAFLPDPVLNISMACNHCFDPVCLNGCPSSAYFRSQLSGAVIIDPDKCLGCRYCVWNCPYDAPKYNWRTGTIQKCNYCFHRIEENLEPACSSSCPTGALSFGEIPDGISYTELRWMAEKNLNPSLHLTGNRNTSGPEIVPSVIDEEIFMRPEPEREGIKGEWSLILFSFLSVISVALTSSGLFNDNFTESFWPALTMSAAAIFSIFHLGNKRNIWRAAMNIRNSPLSREIAIFAIYATLLISGIFFNSQSILVASSIAGLSLLLAIDNIYTYSAPRKLIWLHPGQAFISGLLMISFFMGEGSGPFLFIASIKLAVSICFIRSKIENYRLLPVRSFRAALLIISSAIFITETGKGTTSSLVILLTGELLDRILFYLDFEPENIKKIINN